MDYWLTLTDEEKEIGLAIMHDTEVAKQYKESPLISFLYDTELQKLVLQWAQEFPRKGEQNV